MEGNMKLLKLVVLLAAVTLFAGCASVVTENSKKVNVKTSNNQKATIMVDGATYEAPTVVTLVKDGTDKIISTDAEGCAKQTVATKKIEAAFWGNILIGGLIGSTTDSVGNKMWTYEDEVTISCN